MKNKQGFPASTCTKGAFTLAEMLMVLFIIGVLIVFSILALRRSSDEFGPLYYRAWEALKIANYNVFEDRYPAYARKYPSKINAQTDENYKGANDEDTKNYFKNNPGGICQRFLEWINISEGQVNCAATPIDPNGDDSQFDGNLSPGGHLAFKGSNSQRFYFGAANNQGTIIKTELESTESDIDNPGTTKKQEVGWFIVYVDLNGERGPNATTVVNGKSPDIVAFAVTNLGGVAPIGLPRVERKYLTAKVGYPDTYCWDKYDYPTKYGCTPKKDEDGNLIKIDKRFSNTMTYQEAVRRAWGCTLGIDTSCKKEYGTYEIADEADTIDFTPRPQVLKKIRDEYATLEKPTATIDDNNAAQNKSPASAAPDKLPGDCVANDPFANPCKVLIEKYQK